MSSQATSSLPLSSSSSVVTGSRCHAFPARRQNSNAEQTARTVAESLARVRRGLMSGAVAPPSRPARTVHELAKGQTERRPQPQGTCPSETVEMPPRRVNIRDRVKNLNTAPTRPTETVYVPPRRVTAGDRAKAASQRPPWENSPPPYNRWARSKRPQGQPEGVENRALGLGRQEKPLRGKRPPWEMSPPPYNRWARWKRPEGQAECAEKRALGLGRQEKCLQGSSQRRGASKQLEELHAAPLAMDNEPTRGRGLNRGISSQRRDACTPMVEQVTAGLTVESTVESTLHRRKRVDSPLGAQRPTRLPCPRLTIPRRRLIITRGAKPRSYRSILKKAGAPKKHKSVRFAESEQVHTIDWTAEHADDSLKHLLDEHALRPISWTTGSLNTPTLRDPNGTHSETWKTVQSGDEVITGFRTPQQRARVGQISAFYRAQARDGLDFVTNPDLVEVKQMIPGFYGRRSTRATPMWRGVMFKKHDAVEDALPPFVYGEATVRPLGGWFFRSEAFQCHSNTTDLEPGIYGRYQCEKGGKCVRFSHARPCGCEGKWYRRFGPVDDLKIYSLPYTPSFMQASTARLQQWTAVTRGGDGLTVASIAESVTAATVLTEPDVAEPHPRPFVTARRQPNYPRSARYKAKERVRERSRSPVMDNTADTTRSRRPGLDLPSYGPEFLAQVKKQVLGKYTGKAPDSKSKSTLSPVPASYDPVFIEQVMKQMIEKNPWMAPDYKSESSLSSVSVAHDPPILAQVKKQMLGKTACKAPDSKSKSTVSSASVAHDPTILAQVKKQMLEDSKSKSTLSSVSLSHDPAFLAQVKKHMFGKTACKAPDSKSKSTLSSVPASSSASVPASYDPVFMEQVMKQMIAKNPWMSPDYEFESTVSSVAASRV